jgi:outer membrane protein
MSIRNFLVPVALAVVAGAGALPTTARAQQKIAYVDLQRALNEVEEGKAAKAGLKREFDQKQKLLDERKTEFDKLRGEMEKQSAVMSDEARREKQADLERRGAELQGFFVQLQKELSDREREATRGIFEKMHGLVKEIADAEGVAVVIASEALIYAQPSLDLTNELVRKYNGRFKPGAAAPPKSAAAPAKGAGGGDKKQPAPKKESK